MDEVDGIEVLFDTTRQRFERKDAMPSLVTKEVKLPPTVKELATDLWNTHYLLHPDRKEKMFWDGFVGILIFYSVLVVPFRIGFSQPACEGTAGYIFEWMVDAFFFLDICVAFDTAYIDKEDFIITDRYKISKHYLATWFAIDFTSTMPIDTIVSAVAESSSAPAAADSAEVAAVSGGCGADTGAAGSVKLVKVLRLIRLMKLMRLLKLGKSFKRYMAALGISQATGKLLKLFCGVIFLSHLLACCWFYIGYEGYVGVSGPDSWVKSFFGETDPIGEGEDPGSAYITSMYWTIATMTAVGYGDISATNDVERFFSILTQVLGAAFFGFIVGSMSSLMDTMDLQSVQRKEKVGMIKAYMRDRALPRDLSARVLTYYHYYLERVSSFEETDILSELSNNLRAQVMVEANAPVLFSIRLFRQLDRRFYALIFTKLKPLLALSEEVVAQQGFTATEMYFLQSGTVEQFVTVPAIHKRKSLSSKKKKTRRYGSTIGVFKAIGSGLKNTAKRTSMMIKSSGAAKRSPQRPANTVATWQQDRARRILEEEKEGEDEDVPERGVTGASSASGGEAQGQSNSIEDYSVTELDSLAAGMVEEMAESGFFPGAAAASAEPSPTSPARDVRPEASDRVSSQGSGGSSDEANEAAQLQNSTSGNIGSLPRTDSSSTGSTGSPAGSPAGSTTDPGMNRSATIEMKSLPVRKIKLMTYDDLDDIKVAEHTSGSHFGEVALLQYRLRISSFRSRGYSNLFCLSLHDLNDSLMECPSLNHSMPGIAKTRATLVRHIKQVMMKVSPEEAAAEAAAAAAAAGEVVQQPLEGQQQQQQWQQPPGGSGGHAPSGIRGEREGGAEIRITDKIRERYSLPRAALDAYNTALPENIVPTFYRRPTVLLPNRFLSKQQFKERSATQRDVQRQRATRRKSLVAEYKRSEERETARRRSLVGDDASGMALVAMNADTERRRSSVMLKDRSGSSSSSSSSSKANRGRGGRREEQGRDPLPAFVGAASASDGAGGDRGDAGSAGSPSIRREAMEPLGVIAEPVEPFDPRADAERSMQEPFDADCLIFHPHAPWRTQWDLGVGALILYSVLIIPFRIGFGVDCTHIVAFVFDCLVDIMFFLDIILNFRTAYFDRERVSGRDREMTAQRHRDVAGIVTKPLKIAKRYLRGWFWIDIVSTVPIDMIVQASLTGTVGGCGGQSEVRSIKLVRVLRLVRLVKMVRVLKLAKAVSVLEEEFDVSPTLIRLAKLCMQMAFFAHLMSCSFFFTYSQFSYHPTWVGSYAPEVSAPNELYTTNRSSALTGVACGSWIDSECHSGRGDRGPYDSYAAAIGDLDGDNINDVVVVNRHQRNQLFLSGTAGDQTHTLVADSPIATSYVMVDYAGEGHEGAGGWQGTGMGWGPGFSHGVAIADVNGDSFNDIIVANYGQPNELFLGDGKGGFTVQHCWNPMSDKSPCPDSPVSSHSMEVVAADLNGDGAADLVVANTGAANELFLSDGAGNLVLQPNSPLATEQLTKYGGTQPEATASHGVAIADVNGDSHSDIIVANFGQPNQVFLGDGEGNLALDASSAISQDYPVDDDGNSPHGFSEAVDAADLNGDGAADVAFANAASANELFISDGNGGHALEKTSPMYNSKVDRSWAGSHSYSYGIALANLTSDSKPDVLVVNQLIKHRLYRNVYNSSTGVFGLTLDTDRQDADNSIYTENQKTLSGGTPGDMGWSFGLAVGDVNGDGYNDVIVLNRGQFGIHRASLGSKVRAATQLHFPRLLAISYLFRVVFPPSCPGHKIDQNSTPPRHDLVAWDLPRPPMGSAAT
eukprot:g912.t1